MIFNFCVFSSFALSNSSNSTNKCVCLLLSPRKSINDNTEGFSTLRYFHQDLNLDENIMSKRKSVLINKLEKWGGKFFKTS